MNNSKNCPIVCFALIYGELGKIDVQSRRVPAWARVLTAINCRIVRGGSTVDLTVSDLVLPVELKADVGVVRNHLRKLVEPPAPRL